MLDYREKGREGPGIFTQVMHVPDGLVKMAIYTFVTLVTKYFYFRKTASIFNRER